MKNLLTIILFIAFSYYLQAQTATQPSLGDGSENNPYQIATLENLCWLSQTDSIWNDTLHFVQTTDIDASDTKNWNGGAGFTPIGNGDTLFIGNYNGKGHVISDIHCSGTHNMGLFGFISKTTLDSIGLKNTSVVGSVFIGSLVGRSVNASIIKNCYVQNADVYSFNTGNADVGCLVGIVVSSTVTNCYATGKIEAFGSNVGGITGRLYGGKLLNSYAVCDVYSKKDCIGGLVGREEQPNSEITNCFSLCNVAGVQYVGGIVGYKISGTTSYCYSVSTVAGTSSVRACSGLKNTNISCYYNSDVTNATDESATALKTNEMKVDESFDGFNFDTIWAIQSGITYPVLRGFESNPPFALTDVLFGATTIDLIKLLDNDYDIETQQTKLALKIVGCTTTSGTISNTTYTFSADGGGEDQITYRVGEAIAAGDTLWGNTVISRLIQAIPAGDGSELSPFEIANIANLKWLSEADTIWEDNLYFIQTADIDASDTRIWNSGEGFSPIGSSLIKFSGYYNGKGHTISSLYINHPDSNYVGLFGIATNTTLDSLGLKNPVIYGHCYVGALIGSLGGESVINACYVQNGDIVASSVGNADTGGLVGVCSATTISNCYATGSVIAIGSNLGGIVGHLYSSNLYYSYSACDVTSNQDCVGGLVGRQNKNETISSEIANSYAICNVYGNRYVGGVVGFNQAGSTSFCYAAGTVNSDNFNAGGCSGYSLVSDCYYNSDVTSVEGKSATPLTTEQMKNADSFNGWDFDAVWAIWPGYTYPALKKISNAPFAFADTLSAKSSIDLAKFKNNDYDHETWQEQLVYKLISYPGSVNENQYKFNPNLKNNEADTIVYQIGELVAIGDTLWGNKATSIFICTDVEPVIESTAPDTATVDVEYIYNVAAADLDDALTYTLSNAPSGMTISENVISWIPPEGTTSSGEVTLIVSDGILNAIEKFTIAVADNGTSIDDIVNTHIAVYPNPVNSVLIINSNSIIESIQLISATGAIIYSDIVNNTKVNIDLQDVQKGIYLVKINSVGRSIMKKIVKQ